MDAPTPFSPSSAAPTMSSSPPPAPTNPSGSGTAHPDGHLLASGGLDRSTPPTPASNAATDWPPTSLRKIRPADPDRVHQPHWHQRDLRGTFHRAVDHCAIDEMQSPKPESSRVRAAECAQLAHGGAALPSSGACPANMISAVVGRRLHGLQCGALTGAIGLPAQTGGGTLGTRWTRSRS